MRQIDRDMNRAIRHRKNMSKQNTSVRCYREEIEVRLHGNLIGTVDTASNQLRIFDGGWQTVTTNPDLMHLWMSLPLAWVYFKRTGSGSYLTD